MIPIGMPFAIESVWNCYRAQIGHADKVHVSTVCRIREERIGCDLVNPVYRTNSWHCDNIGMIKRSLDMPDITIKLINSVEGVGSTVVSRGVDNFFNNWVNIVWIGINEPSTLRIVLKAKALQTSFGSSQQIFRN